jgi:hypothetical protein
MTAHPNLSTKNSRLLSLPSLAATVLLSLAASVSLTACQNVATYVQPSLVRVIDASYSAPAIDVSVENQQLAANLGLGSITAYGTVTAEGAAQVSVAPVGSTTALASTTATLLAGQQHTVFLTDNGATPGSYNLTILADQLTPAPNGQSAFRFLNQALKTGAVDVYLVPSGATLATTVPIVTNLAAGAVSAYIGFPSQPVTMVITPTGVTTSKYSSPAIALYGGEVRTVLILDTKLTTNPPVNAILTDDAD